MGSEKICVVHHSNLFGLGGTEKIMFLFCKYLDRSRFEVHALAPQHPVPPYRAFRDRFCSMLGFRKYKARVEQNAYSHARLPEFQQLLGADHVHLYTLRTLPGILNRIAPSILHVHHAGHIQPPLDQPRAVQNIPYIFTTNAFGFTDDSPHQKRISRILFVSHWLKDVAAPWSQHDARCQVLYAPVETPVTQEDLRKELGIPPQTFVLGRIGRNADDIHDPISLKAYKRIENSNTLFLVVAPPPIMIRQAHALGIRNIRYLNPCVDDLYLSKFYNTLDVLAHARLDGETFGCVIAEAMMHGKPVVSHRSVLRNAQEELLDESCGFIVNPNDEAHYAECLKTLMDNPALRTQMGVHAAQRARHLFEAGMITQKLETLYQSITLTNRPFPKNKR